MSNCFDCDKDLDRSQDQCSKCTDNMKAKDRREFAEYLVKNKGDCADHDITCKNCPLNILNGCYRMFAYEWAMRYLAVHKKVKYFKSVATLLTEYPDSYFDTYGSLIIEGKGARNHIIPGHLHLLGKPVPEYFEPDWMLIEYREENSK